MKGILIDPKNKTILEVEVAKRKNIYTYLDCSSLNLISVDDENVMYFSDDDELYSDGDFIWDSKESFFTTTFSIHKYPCKGLILGLNDELENLNTTLSTQEVNRIVTFNNDTAFK